eukprot:gene4874-6830_t
MKEQLSIPLLSVSLNFDAKHYISRLLQSIDYPIKKVIVQIGNRDQAILESLLEQINSVKFNLSNSIVETIEVNTLNYNPGAANGFNYGIKELLYNSNYSKTDYVVIANSDIEFYPGSLQKIAIETAAAIKTDSLFGIGFTGLCCGGEWSTIILSKAIASEVGLFDENFYPGFYEDDDYAIRISLSAFRVHHFNDVHLKHGEINGSVDYMSGLMTHLYHAKYNKNQGQADVDHWRQKHQQGVKHAEVYISKKWGIHLNSKKLDCKPPSKIKSCVVPYRNPFNNNLLNISSWIFLNETLQRMHHH